MVLNPMTAEEQPLHPSCLQLSIATIRTTTLRLQRQIFIAEESIPMGQHVFCINDLPCPHRESLPSIMFYTGVLAAAGLRSDVAQ